jgi:glucose-1-phosphate thymidylyltransferase
MKGIVLAGGTGSRLWPITKGVCKQLLPIYDKPLIHYPISTMFLAGIREILIISTPKDLDSFQSLLGDGSDYGVDFQYKIQEKPQGIADAFIIGEDFIGDNNVSLILGDNIFHGSGFGRQLQDIKVSHGGLIFAQKVADPSNYGIVEFDNQGTAISIEEKPIKPKSDYAIPGLYFYDPTVIEIAKKLNPSNRGEIEISAINQTYLEAGKLEVKLLERGTTWLDTGTPKSLNDASNFIRVIEERSGMKIGCLEEISFNNGWINYQKLSEVAHSYGDTNYGGYLRGILSDSTDFSRISVPTNFTKNH